MYGIDAIFPIQLGIPVMNFFQDFQEEPNDMQRRIYAMIELQQNREKVEEKAQLYKLKIKERFDRKIKDNNFSIGDMVLRWNARKEQKWKHGKFDNLWFGPFLVSKFLENNTLSYRLWRVRNCQVQLMDDSSSISIGFEGNFSFHCIYRCE